MTKIKTKEAELKRQKKFNENREKKMQEKEQLVKQIQEETKEQLLPVLKEKTDELTNYIVDLLETKGEEKVNRTQILSLIARRSLLEVANVGNVSYTPQEIMVGFNMYLEMINRINEIKNFPPTVESFSLFMGISESTYGNWRVDAEKKNVMDYIHSYLMGTLATGGLTGENKEIFSMFLLKTMGKTEQVQPVQHEVTIKTDIDEINAQLSALKGDGVIDAEWEEKDEQDISS